ncbi:MAG: TnpV protein [Clostridiales bacterium]|nr:TnpV protein [Clostridiales bacterium]
MNEEEIIKKAEANEGLTVEEVKIYQQAVKPKKHVYGKYGTLAKQYIEEHNFGKLLSLAGQLPEYLHGVDKAAEDLYDTMWDKLSKSEQYRRTGNYLEDVKRINAMKQVIEEEILSEIVYI